MTENSPPRHCVLCGSQDATILFEAQGCPIFQCQGCGLAFAGIAVEPKTVADYYRKEYYAVAADYAESLKLAATEPSEDHRERVRTASKLARRKTGRILDVGCAAGGSLAAFKQAGWDCVGIEPSEELAAYARAILNSEVHEATLETAALPEASFDVITASHVLEHSPDPCSFLKWCHSLLKQGGVLLIEVPDFGSRMARRQRELWRPLYPDTHLFHFTRSTLSRLLERGGFHVARLRRYGGLGALAPTPQRDGGESSQRRPSALASRFKQQAFEARHLIYRISPLKRFVRFAYWHVLGMNDYLSVWSLKASKA